MAEEGVLLSVERAVATVTLNRPRVHNAFDDATIRLLTRTFDAIGRRRDVRVVVLAGQGESFCAGADLAYMRRCAGFSPAENEEDARALARLLFALDRLPQPTVARVHGPAYGGGVGLVAACDIAVAAETASFALSEVRLGLIPAVISPFVIRAIGESWSRRLILTGERFDAEAAARLGLVHEVVLAGALAERSAALATLLLQGAPDAQRRAKALVAAVSGKPIDEALAGDTAQAIAEARASEDGREGIAAFLEKRPPRWRA